MPELNLEVFPKGWWDKNAGKGEVVNRVEIEPDGTCVGYGTPNEEHDCDLMGCPTIDHVLFVLKGQGIKPLRSLS